jgi:hypothetical protein
MTDWPRSRIGHQALGDLDQDVLVTLVREAVQLMTQPVDGCGPVSGTTASVVYTRKVSDSWK